MPDQYWATSEPTLPLKALALKAGALASAEASTLRVRAPLAPEPMELPVELLLEEPAAGVPVAAIGVPVALAVELPLLLFELLLEEEEDEPLLMELPMPLTLKACQGPRT